MQQFQKQSISKKIFELQGTTSLRFPDCQIDYIVVDTDFFSVPQNSPTADWTSRMPIQGAMGSAPTSASETHCSNG